jgi:hypothetical protein
MFQEYLPTWSLHVIINVVGHWPNKVSTTCVEGKIGESGVISPNILDIGTYWVTDFMALWTLIKVQYHTQVHNYYFSPFDRIIRLLFLHILRDPLNFNSIIVLKHYDFHIVHWTQLKGIMHYASLPPQIIMLAWRLVNPNDQRLD